MPVFDKSTKVGRKVNDPGTDKSLPGGKALSYGAMTSATAVAGTTGLDCKLVHGDRWQQIDGSFTEQTNSNVKTTILADETRNVIGNRTLSTLGSVTGTVASNYTKTVVGSTVRTYVGAAAYTYTSNHVATHASPQCRFEPGVYMHAIMQRLWAGNSLNNIGVFYFQFFVSYNSITPTYINLIPILNFSYITINVHFEILDNGNRALEAKLRAMKGDIEAMRGYVEAMELDTAVQITVISLAVNSYAL